MAQSCAAPNGYRRFEGLQAAAAPARLYAAMRLFVNFFQPSCDELVNLGIGERASPRK
jgi:hypothetical protein